MMDLFNGIAKQLYEIDSQVYVTLCSETLLIDELTSFL